MSVFAESETELEISRRSTTKSLPKISEWPHVEVFDRKVLLPFSLGPIFPGTPASPCGWCIGLAWTGWCRVADVVFINLLLMFARTRSACPTVPPGRFRVKRRLYTAHMKVFLASVTLNSFSALDIRGSKEQVWCGNERMYDVD